MLRRTLRFFALRVLLLAARLTDRWRRDRVPVLVFHSVDDSGSPVSLSQQRFRAHLDYLRRHAFHPMSLGRAVDLVRAGGRFPPRSVVLTFDDGYRNNQAPIESILQSGGEATLFVPSGCVGLENRWDAGHAEIPRLPLLSADELSALNRAGCEIGAHSISHANLADLSGPDLREEIDGSLKALSDLLGAPVRTFAYPYGAQGPETREALRRTSVEAACTTARGYLMRDTPLLEIPRFPAGDIRDVIHRLVLHRGYHWYARP